VSEQAGRVSESVETVEWLTVPDVAERLGVPVTKVHQLLRDGGLAAARRDGVLRVPALFIRGDAVVKGLTGVLTLLHDGGYDDEAAIRWLHTPDESLPGTPVEALQADRSREVKRRAQAMAF
jgi:excisionase family DNA binding protein